MAKKKRPAPFPLDKFEHNQVMSGNFMETKDLPPHLYRDVTIFDGKHRKYFASPTKKVLAELLKSSKQISKELISWHQLGGQRARTMKDIPSIGFKKKSADNIIKALAKPETKFYVINDQQHVCGVDPFSEIEPAKKLAKKLTEEKVKKHFVAIAICVYEPAEAKEVALFVKTKNT